MSAALFSPVALGLAATLVVLFLMTRGRKVMLKVCTAVALPAFFGGLFLYTVGYMPHNGGLGDVFTAMLRGLFSTGRMFLINDDYGFLLDDPTKLWLTGNIVFQVLFWLCHVLALVVTVSAVMGLFGRQLIHAMRLRMPYDFCTIICGSSDQALTLGENIATHDGTAHPDSKHLVVYLVPEITEQLSEDVASWGAVPVEYDKTNFGAMLRRAGFGAKSGRIPQLRVIIIPDKATEAVNILDQTLDLAAQLNMEPQRLALYLISENRWVLQYARDRHSPWAVHLACEAELAARRMIINHPPYLALPFENGIACRDLVVMILGFGSSGSQALLRLIVGGQFVGSNMRAIVVDKDMNNLRGSFRRSYPGFFLENSCCSFSFHQIDVGNEDFFALLDTVGADVNYIVAALNDDNLNLETAQAVADHYRRAGRPKPHMSLAVSIDTGAQIGNTTFFSGQKDIYSESVVIRNSTDAMAMAANFAYVESLNGPQDRSPEEIWYQDTSPVSQASSRASADFFHTMLHLAGITEQQAIDSGVLTTDDTLARTLAHTEHLRWNAFHYSIGYTPMPMARVEERLDQMIADGAEDLWACRKDSSEAQHACLVSWDDLAKVSSQINKLMEKRGILEPRNFQDSDFAIIKSIPQSLKVAKEYSKGGKKRGS